jgi:primosomal protein N' (replication factor Y) (superfamily II helicase)
MSGVQVVVDVPLFHLDRPFTYRLPEPLRGSVRLGSRVKVPFGGRKRVDGWVVGFSDELPPGARDVIRLVSPLPAFGARELALLRWVADRWVGTLADVLRLAVPPRVAAVEAAGGSGGLKSEAPTQVAGGHPQPSGSPPVNKGSGGLKSGAATSAVGGHLQPSGRPPVNPGPEYYSRGRTLAAWAPLCPRSTSYSTGWPSSRVR